MCLRAGVVELKIGGERAFSAYLDEDGRLVVCTEIEGVIGGRLPALEIDDNTYAIFPFEAGALDKE